MIIKCPKCGKLLEVQKEKVGKKEICEHCEHIFVVDDSIIYKPVEETSPKIQSDKVSAEPTLKQKRKRGSKILLLLGGAIGLIILIFVIVVIIVAVDETKQEEMRQVEIQRQQNAFRQLIVSDIDFGKRLFQGGIDLYSFTISNPTKYAFRRIRYQFYDVDDNVVKVDDYVGPLMPYETKEFKIDLHCEGLWEHRYGIRIKGGEVTE